MKEFDKSLEFRDNISFSLNNEPLAEVCASWLGKEVEVSVTVEIIMWKPILFSVSSPGIRRTGESLFVYLMKNNVFNFIFKDQESIIGDQTKTSSASKTNNGSSIRRASDADMVISFDLLVAYLV